MNLRTTFAAGLMLVGIISSPDARATSMVELTQAQMVTASEAIVRGTVQEIWTERDQNGSIWTRVQVDVSEVYKGDAEMDAVIVDQLGGKWGGRGLSIAGGAQFSIGEEAILFLETLDNGQVVCVGMEQGKFTVKLDPVTREQIAFQTRIPEGRVYDHRFVPLPPEGERRTIEQVRDDILISHEAGWDGVSLPGISDEELQQRARIATPLSPVTQGVK